MKSPKPTQCIEPGCHSGVVQRHMVFRWTLAAPRVRFVEIMCLFAGRILSTNRSYGLTSGNRHWP